ncbi:MAG: hypothetical protein DRP11_00270 [Candidatus Aenigmatarchaeota archaeon]|nr:MAG: hypothetical protein DRP11_00270 [Candidatus Aenigmarchaeota archaeon]
MYVVYLVTELYKPVGGLYRYTDSLIRAWNEALSNGKTNIEPIVIGVKDPKQPLADLQQSERFKEFIEENEGVNVYEARRGGRTCYFIEGKVPDISFFHYILWERYRIKSHKSSKWKYYTDTLSPFWYWAPRVIRFLMEKEGIKVKCIDAQDWLAFPAGFLARDELEIPLNCRLHSGEYGRSLGNPDLDAAPVWIEAASLVFSDYVQGVSINETIFEITHLMPLRDIIVEDVKERKGVFWYGYQKLKERKIENFLIYEPREELVMLMDVVGGMPNGIHLNEWDKITKKDILNGKKMLKRMMPDKKGFIFFIGRPDYRKGLDFLLEAFSKILPEHPETGLVIASSMNEEEFDRYSKIIERLSIKESTYILDKWLEDDEKKSLFCASDIIALPSLYEPFGIVALEGLAADYACEKNGTTGPVVVCGNTGGMDEIIKSGVSGFEVPINNFKIDPDILAHIFEDIFTKRGLRKKISKNGAKRVQSKHFRWDYILEKVFEVYDKAVRNFESLKRSSAY